LGEGQGEGAIVDEIQPHEFDVSSQPFPLPLEEGQGEGAIVDEIQSHEFAVSNKHSLSLWKRARERER